MEPFPLLLSQHYLFFPSMLLHANIYGGHLSVGDGILDARLLVSRDGPDHNVLKIKPPIVFGAAEAERLIDTLTRVLGEDAANVDR